jgi:dephospho-CoA kinase
MIKVGITGGIGSGKTTICRVFEMLNVPVYYADDRAKKLLDTNSALKEKILDAFGTDVLDEQKMINKARLAQIVFNDSSKLNILNSFVHPLVQQDFEQWTHTNAKHNYLIKEAAILFESKANKGLQKVICVNAPIEMRITRTMQRQNTSREEVVHRIHNQWTDEQRTQLSDYIIINDETRFIIPQVIEIDKQLRNIEK